MIISMVMEVSVLFEENECQGLYFTGKRFPCWPVAFVYETLWNWGSKHVRWLQRVWSLEAGSSLSKLSFLLGGIKYRSWGNIWTLTAITEDSFFFGYTSQHVRSLIPIQGLNPHSLNLECSLNHWTAREGPRVAFRFIYRRAFNVYLFLRAFIAWPVGKQLYHWIWHKCPRFSIVFQIICVLIRQTYRYELQRKQSLKGK